MKPHSEATHTPTPWRIEKAPSWNLLEKRNSYTLKVTADGLTVAMMGMDQEANAAFIVRAVNAHEELIQMLHVFIDCIDGDVMATQFFDSTFVKKAKQAIAKAEGRV